MSYISKNYNLQHIMTIATLTWAAIVALWYRYAGIMWSDKNLINKFLSYSKNNFEKYVELPYDNYLIEKTKSDIADIKNLTEWIKAGSSMWAAFLSNFVDNNEAYTHIDIAGPAINSFEPYGLMNKWMTWFWVDSISTIFTEL
jgi:leucyl aminopeptidase